MAVTMLIRGCSLTLSAVLAISASFIGLPSVAADQLPEATESAAAAKQAKLPIKIGYITTLTGPGSMPCKRTLNGLKLYLEEIHYRMANRPVELVVANDELNPAKAKEKVRELVEKDKVNLVDGMAYSNLLYVLAPVLDSYQIPGISDLGGADDITQRKRKKWVLRTPWTSSQPSQAFGDYVANTLHYKKVVTLCSDYAFGYETAGGFQHSFEQSGGKVIQKLWAPLGFTDFSNIIKQIRPDADAVFMCIVGDSSKIIPKQYKELGPKLPIIGATTSFDETTFPEVGKELSGGISVSPYSNALATHANIRFKNLYKQAYGEKDDPGWFVECGYTTGMWINKAVEAVNGKVEDREKFLSALKHVELPNAPRGPIKLDDYGSPIQNIYVRRVDKVNGKYQNTVIHTYPAVSQFWKWKPAEFLKQPVYSKDYPPCN